MPSFQIVISPKRRSAARLIHQVRSDLQRLVEESKKAGGVNQSDIAKALDVHRSVISRELKGTKDLTLGRVGEIAWALGKEASVAFVDADQPPEKTNIQPATTFTGTSGTTAVRTEITPRTELMA